MRPRSPERRGRAARLLFSATLLLATGCIKQKESLIIVALTADLDLADATVVSISASKVTQTYAIGGLTQNTPVQRGIYLDAKTTGNVAVSATAQGGSPCMTYTKTTVVKVSAGAIVNAALKLSAAGACSPATDAGGGGDASPDAIVSGGTGGRAGGTGGTTGGTGGVIVVGTGGRSGTDGGVDTGSVDAGGGPSLTNCTSYVHSLDTDCSSLTTVYGVAVSPNGQTVVTGGDDTRAKIWHFNGRTLTPSGLADLPSDGAGYGTAAFSPDGSILALGWSDGIDLWNTTTWVRIRKLVVPDSVYDLGFTPDGLQIMSIDSGNLYIHNISTAAPLHSVAIAESTWLMAVSPIATAGTTVAAVALQNGTVRVFTHTAAGFVANLTTLVADANASPGHTASVRFSRDGTLLAAGNTVGQISIWRYPITSSTATSPIIDVRTPTTSGTVNWLAFSLDNRALAVAGASSKSVSTFAVAAPRSLIALNRTLGQSLQSITYSPNGAAILAGGITCGYVLVCAD